ncbi:MAG: hypothetical protein J6P57_09805 [Lachnospiraceae bacterium]|nr:hypothetical protein [Lachnospiraceae bacterium]
MNLEIIYDNEILYRVIRKSYPDGFIDGKPTAALFIDAKGVSVDRDGGREEKSIIDNFIKRFEKNDDYGNAVKIEAGKCREIGTYPNPVGNKKNIYHAEIHESKDVKEISFLKALQLANECVVVSSYENII